MSESQVEKREERDGSDWRAVCCQRGRSSSSLAFTADGLEDAASSRKQGMFVFTANSLNL